MEQAQEDLRWAKDLAERGGYHIACFLAQQVGEKALKAFLYAQGEEMVIRHSVARLCGTASHWRPEFGEHLKRWSILDGYYVPTRYPNSLPDSIPARVSTGLGRLMAVEMVEKIEGQRIFRGVWGPWDAPVCSQRLERAMKVNRFHELECGREARKPVGMVLG